LREFYEQTAVYICIEVVQIPFINKSAVFLDNGGRGKLKEQDHKLAGRDYRVFKAKSVKHYGGIIFRESNSTVTWKNGHPRQAAWSGAVNEGTLRSCEENCGDTVWEENNIVRNLELNT